MQIRSQSMIFSIVLLLTLVMSIGSSFSTVQIEVLSTNPAPLVAGEYGDVTIQISNNQISDNDNSVESVEISVSSNPYVIYIESDSKKVSNLRVGEVATRTLRVYIEENTPEGFLSVPIRIKTNNDDSIYYERFYVDGFENRVNLSTSKISATPKLLVKDSTYNSISIEIVNFGERDAELSSVVLEPVEGELRSSYSFSNQDSIGTISSGGVVEAQFVMDILDISTQRIETSLRIEYQEEIETNSYEKMSISLPVVIELSPTPDFEVISVEQISEFRHETTENVFRVVLQNVGTQSAEDVRVRVIPDKSYPLFLKRV